MSLRGKLVLITGANSDIGVATAIECASRGAHLILGSRRPPVPGFDVMLHSSVKCMGILYGDLSRPDNIAKFAALVKEKCAELDAVVSLTGAWHDEENLFWSSPLDELPGEAITAAFGAGPIAMMALSRELIGHMKPGGSIVNMSAHFDPIESVLDECLPYRAACSAVDVFTKLYAKELEDHGREVRVNAVAPSWVNTRAVKKFFPRITDKFKSLLLPKEVAQVIAGLITHGCDTNGEVVPILPKRG